MIHYLGIGVVSPEAIALENEGWQTWLKTLAPRSFSAPFSKEHIQFWDHFWSILMRRRRGETIPPEERDIIMAFSRGYGKSTNAEFAAIAEGCILGKGLCLYLSDSQLLAEEHLFSIKAIIETPVFAKYYPAMSRPKMLKGGTQARFTQDAIICENGWAVVARGLTANVRGGRVGTDRFSLVVLDDIDNLTDSLAVIEKKKRIISRTVFPAMSKDGVSILAQNLITKNSIASQILDGRTDILSRRTVIGGGAVKAFSSLELEPEQLPDGKTRWQIKHCVPTWAYFNLEDARAFLAKSGKEAFLAEYQHEFDDRRGKCISNYDPEAQVITWSEFQRVFKVRYIPEHWRAVCGVDIGYSDGQHPHYSAWMFLAVAAQNSPLPGAQFVYRSKVFQHKSIDDQAIEVWRDLLPSSEREFAEYVADFSEFPALQEHFGVPEIASNGLIQSFQMSHERTGEMLTLRTRYGLPFAKFKHWKAHDGIAQWNTLSLADRTKPNPFKIDQIEEDGKYEIGRPGLYYIVDDDQYGDPRDERGLKTFLRQLENWNYVPVEITKTGLTEEKPSKVDDDTLDALKALLQYIYLEPTPLTEQEQVFERMPEVLKEAATPDARQQRGYWLQQEEKRIRIEKERQARSNVMALGDALDNFDRMRGR